MASPSDIKRYLFTCIDVAAVVRSMVCVGKVVVDVSCRKSIDYITWRDVADIARFSFGTAWGESGANNERITGTLYNDPSSSKKPRFRLSRILRRGHLAAMGLVALR